MGPNGKSLGLAARLADHIRRRAWRGLWVVGAYCLRLSVAAAAVPAPEARTVEGTTDGGSLRVRAVRERLPCDFPSR